MTETYRRLSISFYLSVRTNRHTADENWNLRTDRGLMAELEVRESEKTFELELSLEEEQLAKLLHEKSLIIDGTALAYVLDRQYSSAILQAGVNSMIVSAFVGVETGHGDHTHLALRALDDAHRKIALPDSDLMLVRTASDILEAKKRGKLGIVLAFQNGTPLGDDLGLVHAFYELGVRCIQLTYNDRNLIGDGCLERHGAGLSQFGVDIVHALQEIGILVDLSHVGDATVNDVLDIATRPVAFTHCNARALCNNVRNKTDEQIIRLSERGGVVGVVAFPAFVCDGGKVPTLSDLLDHLDYCVGLAGPGAVGLGLDFIEGWTADGIGMRNLRRRSAAFGTSYEYPIGLEGVAQVANLTRGLVARGYKDDAIEGFLGQNLYNLLARVWKH